MATIPRTGPEMGLGSQIARPAPDIQIQPTYNAGRALGNAGSALESANQLMQEHQQQQVTAKMALALATAQNGAHDAHDAVLQGLTSGTIAPEEAQAELKKRTDDVVSAQTQGLPTVAAQAVKTQMVGTQGALARSMGENVFKFNQSATAATIDETGNQLQRDVLRRGPSKVSETYDAIIDTTGASAGYSPAQIQAKKEAFRESTTVGYYNQRGATLHAAGDLDGVTSTLNEVLGPAGDAINPTARAQVTNHLVGLQNQLLAQKNRDADAAERERIRRENEAVDAVNAVRTVVLNGSYLSADAIRDVTMKAAGTTQEAPLTAILGAQSQIAGFASLPADQRAAQLERYRAEGANPAVGTSPQNQQSIEILNKVDEKANAAAKDDPWKAAETYGVIKGAPLLDVSDPNGIAPALDYRMQQIGKVETWIGHKVSPLQPAEAQQLSEELKAMPPDQAASLLSVLGQSVKDPDRIAALAKQLGKGAGGDDAKVGTIGLAMAYAGDLTENGKLTSEMILRGDQALRNKTSLVDTTAQSGWKATIFNKVSGAFSSQEAENQAMDAAYKIAAANGGDVDAAIKAATGGIITHGLGKVPLPMGMDESTFNKQVAAITPASLAPQAPNGAVYVSGLPMPLDKFAAQLPDATFVHAGQGLYAVKAGNSFVTNQLGKRIVLRITQ